MAALEKMVGKDGKINKKRGDVRKKKIESAARKMIEWEAEEGSGDESVDSLEYPSGVESKVHLPPI